MPDKKSNDFDDLFGDDRRRKDDIHEEEAVSFEDIDFNDDALDGADTSSPGTPGTDDLPLAKKKRSSDDFEADMDALLLTAQSPMIIEGMKYLTMKEYTAGRLPVFAEAIKGVELFITILRRNPKKYFKLANMMKNDIDYKEVEKTAFNLYNIKFKATPVIEDHILRAYELLKDKLRAGYEKSLISKTSAEIKKFFLLSGGINTDVIREATFANDPAFKAEITNINQRINAAINIMKSNNPEIAKGLKGRDVNIFIIKASEMLAYYYRTIGNTEASEYYNRVYNNHKKYHIIRD